MPTLPEQPKKPMLPVLGLLFEGWIWKMAWRDSRSSRRHLLLFSSAIVLGIAALVAIGSFGANLRETVNEQAKSLLGADLAVTSRDSIAGETEALLNSLGGEQAREVIFSSMIRFPKADGTRLAQVRALGGGFPFYGTLETDPPGASADFRQGQRALVEESLMNQFEAKVGDQVKIGETLFTIAGALKKVPGETMAFSTIAARVYIPLAELPKTKLVRPESFARYKVFYKFPPGTDVARRVQKIESKLIKLRLKSETVEERKADLGKAMENLQHFLSLGGFVALLLGGVGVASAIHIHIKEKWASVAVLRCLGAPVRRTIGIYLAQGIMLGLAGSVAGAMVGLLVQAALPKVVADFVPFPIEFSVAWGSVLQATGAGFAICLLFSLLPLVSVRLISPLAALRASEPPAAAKDPARWFLSLLLVAGVMLLAVSQSQRWTQGIGFTFGIGGAFLVLWLAASGVRRCARKLISPRWPYVWRQGMSNLYRPNNRTLLLMLSLGLGTFLILTLFLVQQLLLKEMIPPAREGQPNTALFDIQSDQKEGVAALLKRHGLPVLQEVPMVSMRLTSLQGRAVESLLKDPDKKAPGWALRREYRSTYRDQLVDTETTVQGLWPAPAGAEAVPISVEEGIAKDLSLKLGDEMVFNVQGMLLTNRIAHIRKVDWRRLQPNFFVVFPSKALEDAPGSHVITTRIDGPKASAAFQREMGAQFSNVSTIDLTMALQTIDSIIGKVSFVIRFMAIFTVATGLIVLAGAILSGRYQRLRESILLRTLGASGGTVLRILLVEYFLLGLLASLTGVLLSQAGTWALARFVFEMPFFPSPLPSLLAVAVVTAITMATGMAMSRDILKRPPLEILRQAG